MNLREKILNMETHFLLFGGKGGVGKTTSASSIAIWAGDHGRKVLLISTDPAHSVSDSLDQNLILGEITKVNNTENVWALEINPNEKNDLVSIDSSELSSILDFEGLTPPGMDEAMAFTKVLEYSQNPEFDLIIFDTAPTGHTLRFLGIPDMLSGWLGKLIRLKLKFSRIFSSFKSLFSKQENPEKDILENLEVVKESIGEIKMILTDRNKTSFVIVTIPEILGIYETERLMGSLLQYNINSEIMIVNNLVPANSTCKFCLSRRNMQSKHLQELREIYEKSFQIIESPLYDTEIRSIPLLRSFAQTLLGS